MKIIFNKCIFPYDQNGSIKIPWKSFRLFIDLSGNVALFYQKAVNQNFRWSRTTSIILPYLDSIIGVFVIQHVLSSCPVFHIRCEYLSTFPIRYSVRIPFSCSRLRMRLGLPYTRNELESFREPKNFLKFIFVNKEVGIEHYNQNE